MTAAEASTLVLELLGVIPDERRVNAGESARRLHGDPYVGIHGAVLPDVVVFPETSEEVSQVLRLASRRGVAVVPYGAGTSAEGETIPLRGGISLDLTRLTSIDVCPAAMQATVGAGVTRKTLNAAAAEHGLQFPVDPGADATLGGMAATNASGTTTVRYGSMRQNVLEMEVVLADGRIIRTGSRTLKTSAGYNLAHLFIGSEGTLGVITALTVRLYGIPEHVVAIRAAFPSLEAACRCATGLVGAGVSVTRLELLDAGTITAINAYKDTAMAESPHLLIELAGSRTAVEGELLGAREIAEAEGCLGFDAASSHLERSRLWEARHEVLFAMEHAHPGLTAKGTDTCVPVSELADAVHHARRTIEQAGLPAAILGHVGDGNYHAMFMVDTGDAEALARVKAVDDEIVRDALARGGTCSGELGIGIGKIPYLKREHGDLLPIMRAIKQHLDPGAILNPGKMFTS